MQAPSRSWRIASSSAPASAAPRLIGIWPMPRRIGREAGDVPQARLCERADLAALAPGDADRDRVPVGVVVADDQDRARRRQELVALDLHAAPPANDRRAGRHGESVGARDGLGLQRVLDLGQADDLTMRDTCGGGQGQGMGIVAAVVATTGLLALASAPAGAGETAQAGTVITPFEPPAAVRQVRDLPAGTGPATRR